MANFVNYTYVFINVRDYTGRFALSSYTLSNTPLTFFPDLTTSPELTSTSNLSNKLVRWDFGDGTFSNTLTAVHHYKWPGAYPVRLTVYDRFGNAFDSSYRPTVYIHNFVADQILFQDYIKFIYDVPASKIIDPIILNRQSSWQSYNALSATGYTINLYASGAIGEYQDQASFFNDKWSHLRALSRFYKQSQVGSYLEYTLIDKIQTSTAEVYARVNNGELGICNKNDSGSVFAGTTGTCSFYYVDDTTKNYTTREPPIFVFATLDNSKYNDSYSIANNSFEHIPYPPYGFQNIKPAVLPIIKVRHNPAEQLSISTTGIVGEGTLSSTKFDIPEISWKNTEIPFVIRMKDNENFTTKTYPPLSSSTIYSNLSSLTAFNVTFGLVQDTLTGGYIPLEDVKFYEDFIPDIPQSIGAFYKGYFTVPYATNNCILTASVNIQDPLNFPKDTLIGWIAVPQFNMLLRFFRQQIYSMCPGYLTTTISARGDYFFSNDDRNVYAIQVAPSGNGPGLDYCTWFADGTSDKLFKFDAGGNALSSFSFSNFPYLSAPGELAYTNLLSPVLSSAAPGSIAMDSKSDIWIALFDSVSCIKVDASGGYIKSVACPTSTNFVYYLSGDYNIQSLSGFAGENLFLPSCIDTDSDDNIWVSYTHPVSNFIAKYNTYGSLLTVIPFPSLMAPAAICIDRYKNVWVTAYNYNNNNTTGLTGKNDYLYKFSSLGVVTSGYPLTGFNFIGDITVDGYQNAWVVQDRDTLTRVDASDGRLTNYIAGSGNITNYYNSIGGIASDTASYIWVINNTTGKIYFIDALADPTYAGVNEYPNVDLAFPPNSEQNPVSAFEEQSFQAYGDWLGSRWINKYMIQTTAFRTITGQSNMFNILPTAGQYSVYKTNEDFDAAAFYKSLIFTESMEDKNVFFNDFLGTIVGGASAQPYELGRTIYEKIANYVSNTTDIDKANLDQVISFCRMLSIQFEQYNYPFPPQLRRLVDILSIKHKNLWGEKNKFQQNFYKPGTGIYYSTPNNLGTQLSILSSIIFCGAPLVAYEIFSENYTLINNTAINGYELNDPISLSGYNYEWGWGLIAPRGVSGVMISDYYRFYNYIPVFEDSYYNNIIDWDNSQTTLQFTNSSFNEWSKDSGIMQNLLSYELTKGLRLFLSGSDIVYNN
jgi:hypothetical protein